MSGIRSDLLAMGCQVEQTARISRKLCKPRAIGSCTRDVSIDREPNRVDKDLYRISSLSPSNLLPSLDQRRNFLCCTRYSSVHNNSCVSILEWFTVILLKFSTFILFYHTFSSERQFNRIGRYKLKYVTSVWRFYRFDIKSRLPIDRINHPSSDMNFMRISIIVNGRMLCVRGM